LDHKKSFSVNTFFYPFRNLYFTIHILILFQQKQERDEAGNHRTSGQSITILLTSAFWESLSLLGDHSFSGAGTSVIFYAEVNRPEMMHW
jgi:hypothetical protein